MADYPGGFHIFTEADTFATGSDMLNALQQDGSDAYVAIDGRLTAAEQELSRAFTNVPRPVGTTYGGWNPGTAGLSNIQQRIANGIWEAFLIITLGGTGFSFHASNPGTIALPTGYKVMTGGLGSNAKVGDGVFVDAGSGVYDVVSAITSPGATTVNMWFRSTAGTIGNPTATTPFTWAAGDSIQVRLRVPVVPV